MRLGPPDSRASHRHHHHLSLGIGNSSFQRRRCGGCSCGVCSDSHGAHQIIVVRAADADQTSRRSLPCSADSGRIRDIPHRMLGTRLSLTDRPRAWRPQEKPPGRRMRSATDLRSHDPTANGADNVSPGRTSGVTSRGFLREGVCRAAGERSPSLCVSKGEPSPYRDDYLRAARIAFRSALACLRSLFAVSTEARADLTTVLFEL